MAKLESVQQKIRGLFTKVQVSYRASRAVIKKIRRIAMLSAYWGAVSVVGIVIAIVILQANHVPAISPAYAGAGSWVGTLIGTLLYYIVIGPMGAASIVVAYIMQMVINYPFGAMWSSAGGGFVNVSAVQTGWKLVRDVCNMFFSLILVMIALATVLKIEAYSWKQMLPKLVLMAVLINFSKTICGVFTDFATVAMATFGGSFGSSFGAGVMGAFGLQSFGTLSGTDNPVADDSLINVVLAYIAAAIMTSVFFVVMLSFTVTLLFRIVMLWFLIVLSPLAYITRILPQTQKYSKQWWEMFGRYVTVGPLVTFFLWLSLTMAFGTSVGGSTDATGNPIGTGFKTDAAATSSSSGYTPPAGAFSASSPNVLANFLIATMMLMASLKLIHDMASEAGKLTGAVEGAASGFAMGAMLTPGRLLQTFGAGIGEAQKDVLDEHGKPTGEKTGSAFQGMLYNMSHRAIKDKEGNVVGYDAGRIAKAATTLGSSLFNPIEAYKTLSEGFKKSNEEKKEQAKVRATAAAHDMRKEQVRGKGDSALSMISNVAGLIAGAGLDGKHVVDQVLSGGGVLRMMGKAGEVFAGTEEKAEKAEAQVEADKVALREQTNKLKAEDAPLAATDYAIRNAEATKMADAQREIEAGTAAAKLDYALPEVRAAFEAHIKKMQADSANAEAGGLTSLSAQINGEIAALQAKMGTGGDITLGELGALYGGSSTKKDVTDLFGGAYKGRATSAGKQAEKLEQRLLASGWDKATGAFSGTAYAEPDMVPSGNKDAAGNDIMVMNPKSKKGLEANIKAKKNEAEQLRNQMTSYEEGDSYEERKHNDHMISEEMSKLKDVKNTDELRQHLARAFREKNHPKAEALLKLIAKNYDFNEILQQEMANAGHKDASSDADGLELWRKEMLVKKLGMSEHESLRVANDISYIEEGVGHIQTGRAYQMKNGHLHFVDPAERHQIIAGEMRKASINDKLKWNRLGWGREDANRDFQINESGIKILLSDAVDMAKDRKWENMDSNAKINLSQPRIVAQLRARGVDSTFLANLEEYWRTTGQYEKEGAARAGVSRFATWEEPPAANPHP